MKKDYRYGPMCQSCGMPLMSVNDFGKTETGVVNMDYCNYCYDKGKFTKPDITFDEMVEWVAKHLNEVKEVPLEEGRESAREVLPKLSRWKEKAEESEAGQESGEESPA